MQLPGSKPHNGLLLLVPIPNRDYRNNLYSMNKRIFASMLLSLALLFCLPSFAVAQDDNYGLDATAEAAGIPTSKGITTILGDVIGTALSLVSVLFFALMLYAGIKWMLARGDEASSTKALDTIVGAIIGLVIVLASYALTTFVFKSVGGGAGVGGTQKKEEKKDKDKIPPPEKGTCVQEPSAIQDCLAYSLSACPDKFCIVSGSNCVPLMTEKECNNSTKTECQSYTGLCVWKP